MEKQAFKAYLMLLPVLFMLVTFLCIPLAFGIVQSLGYFPEIGVTRFTLKYFEEILTQKLFWSSFVYTFLYAFLSALLAVLIGVTLSFLFFRNGINAFAESLIRIPIFTPHIVACVMVLLTLSQSGFLARLAYFFGLLQDPSQMPPLVQDKYAIGIISTYVWKGIPFVLLTILSILRSANDRLVMVSENLGASATRTFFSVILPMAIPSIMTSFLLLFAFAFGAFEVPYLLGITSPEALPVLSYRYYVSTDISMKMTAMTINVCIMVFSCIMLVVYLKMDEKRKRYALEPFSEKKQSNPFRAGCIYSVCLMFLFPCVLLVLWSITKRWQWPLLWPSEYSFRGILYVFSPSASVLLIVLKSLIFAVAVTICTLLLTIPAARSLAVYKLRLKGLWYALIWAPFMIPSTTIGISLYSQMLTLQLHNTWTGVLIANVIPCIPYAMLLLQAPCEVAGDIYEKQATMLGSSPLSTLFSITLPILAPAIKGAAILVFTVCFSQYFLTFLIGGGNIVTLPIIMLPYIQHGDRVLASIYSLIFIVSLVVSIQSIESIFKRYSPYNS